VTIVEQTTPVSDEVDRAVGRLLVEETMLLDMEQYEDWLRLLASDVRYWIPIRQDMDQDHAVSIAYDSHRRLEERIMSKQSGLGWAAIPPPRLCHILGGYRCRQQHSGTVLVQSSQLIVVLPERGPQQNHAGLVEYELRPVETSSFGFEIAKKVIRLLDSDRPFAGIVFLI